MASALQITGRVLAIRDIMPRADYNLLAELIAACNSAGALAGIDLVLSAAQAH